MTDRLCRPALTPAQKIHNSSEEMSRLHEGLGAIFDDVSRRASELVVRQTRDLEHNHDLAVGARHALDLLHEHEVSTLREALVWSNLVAADVDADEGREH